MKRAAGVCPPIRYCGTFNRAILSGGGVASLALASENRFAAQL